MGRGLPAVTLVSLVLGMFGVLVLTLEGPGLLLYVPFAIALGVLLVMQKTQIMYVGGGVAFLGAIFGILGMMESIGTEGGTLDLGVTAAVGKAGAIVGFLAASASLLAAQWGKMEPVWMQYGGVIGIVGAIGMVIFTADQLGSLAFNLNYLTAILILMAALPAFTAFRDAA